MSGECLIYVCVYAYQHTYQCDINNFKLLFCPPLYSFPHTVYNVCISALSGTQQPSNDPIYIMTVVISNTYRLFSDDD